MDREEQKTQKVKDDLEKHVLGLFTKLARQGIKENIKQQIADRLHIDTIKVNKILRDNIDMIEQITKITDSTSDLYETDGTIKTTKTLRKAHDRVWAIIDGAILQGDMRTALTALQTANKQIEVTMRKKGELNPELRKDDLIPKDFGEYLIDQMVKAGFVKEKEEAEVKEDAKSKNA